LDCPEQEGCGCTGSPQCHQRGQGAELHDIPEKTNSEKRRLREDFTVVYNYITRGYRGNGTGLVGGAWW